MGRARPRSGSSAPARPLPSGAYCRTAGIGHRTIDDAIQPNRVLELYADGATMVLQGLQLTDPVLARVANNLALALDHPVQINAYLSPSAARGLDVHFDFHDVFVLQLEGRKRWRVWAPLPRTGDPVRAGRQIPLPTLDELGEPMLDLRSERRLPLSASRLPARRRDDRLGVVAPDHRRARDHLAARLPPRPRRGRRGRGAHRVDPGGTLDATRAEPPDPSRLGSHLDAASLRPWLAKEIWHRQPATRLRPLAPPEITVDTPVTLTPGPLLWLTTMIRSTGCRAVFGLGDREPRPPRRGPPVPRRVARPSGTVRRRRGRPATSTMRPPAVVHRLAVEGVIVPA